MGLIMYSFSSIFILNTEWVLKNFSWCKFTHYQNKNKQNRNILFKYGGV